MARPQKKTVAMVADAPVSDEQRRTARDARKHAERIETQDKVRRVRRVVLHTDPPRERQIARDEREKSLLDWIQYYGRSTFTSPFSRNHLKAIAALEAAIREGGQIAFAMPRGEGKTSLCRWTAIYCQATGLRQFIVILAATEPLAVKLLEEIKDEWRDNEWLDEDYPHITTPMRKAEGKPLKAKQMLWRDFTPLGLSIKAGEMVLPTSTDEGQPNGRGGKVTRASAVPYKSNGGRLISSGLTGAFRGVRAKLRDGRIIRPDFVLIDDPQSRESATSDAQCMMRERIIMGDVLGLAGPQSRITVVMPGTIIRRGDLMHRFLDHEIHPEWQGMVTQAVVRWPDAQETLWKEYQRLYKAGLSSGDGIEAAREFYISNREAMDKGAVLSWEHRIHPGDISPLQTIQHELIKFGDQFDSEFQNAPKAEHQLMLALTPDLIMSRAEPDRMAGAVPEWARVIIALTDINPSYALTTAVVAFGEYQRAAVLWYGTQAMNVTLDVTEEEARRAIYEALAEHGRGLAQLPCRPGGWYIDGGGSPKGTVITFAAHAQRICGIVAWCAFGRASRQVRTAAGKGRVIVKGEELLQVTESLEQRWIIWNADYWRELSHKAWKGSPGAPGSCSLPKGDHREFAEQICREQMTGRGEVGGQTIWTWFTAPGAHDYGDVMAMAYMGAAHSGIGSGAVLPTKRQTQRGKQRRRPKVAMET